MLLLASRSTARRAMLESAGVPFEAVDSRTDEDAAKLALRAQGADAARLALGLAAAKAAGVDGGGLVLGADSTLALADGTMLDKPSSRAEAETHLRLLSGARHQLHSAAVLMRDGQEIWSHVGTATMTVRPLSGEFIRTYLDLEYQAVRWSVGCYHLEGRGAQLFEEVEGSHFVVLGLPLLPLLAELRNQGVLQS